MNPLIPQRGQQPWDSGADENVPATNRTLVPTATVTENN